MSNRITIVGSYNQDLVFSTPALPRPGHTVTGEMQTHHGGKGFNQAIAAARLGGSTRFVGSVGLDDAGEAALEFARSHGVNAALQRSSEPTGSACVVVDHHGENQIVVAPGANASLDSVFVQRNIGDESAVVLTQLETSPEAVDAVANWCEGKKALSILNPAPVTPWLNADLWRRFDMITPNEHELAELLGGCGKAVSNWDRPAEIHQACQALGVAQVVVTLGSRGALISTKGGFHLVPVRETTVVDTTGAGDCFNGALAVGLAEGMDLGAAVTLANRAASLSVSRSGAAASMPTREDVEAVSA